MGGKMKTIAITLTLLLTVTGICFGDVIIKSKTSVSGFMGVNTESESTEIIKGDKSYEEEVSTMTGGMMEMMGQSGHTMNEVTIIRLDKADDLFLHIS